MNRWSLILAMLCIANIVYGQEVASVRSIPERMAAEVAEVAEVLRAEAAQAAGEIAANTQGAKDTAGEVAGILRVSAVSAVEVAGGSVVLRTEAAQAAGEIAVNTQGAEDPAGAVKNTATDGVKDTAMEVLRAEAAQAVAGSMEIQRAPEMTPAAGSMEIQRAPEAAGGVDTQSEKDAQDLDAALVRMRKRHVVERIERHRLEGKENNIFITLATGFTNHNQIIATLKLEYSRQIKGNFYWGCNFSANFGLGNFLTYDWSGEGFSPYRNTVRQNLYKIDGMAFYRLPVIRSRLFFRLGAGVGLGYHHIKEFEDSDRAHGDKVLPYLNLQAAWILRISRAVEMKFAPTIIMCPSEFAISPVKLGGPTDVTPWMMDAGFTLTLGCRF